MRKLGTIFKFTAPDHWSELRDGNRYILHGPNSEELIVSAKNPGLKIVQPFQMDARVDKIECWSLLAEAREGDALFYQGVFCDRRGVLLVSLEAPNTVESVKMFEQFLKSVEVASES
jgi:hypothetical protein